MDGSKEISRERACRGSGLPLSGFIDIVEEDHDDTYPAFFFFVFRDHLELKGLTGL